MPRKFYFYQRKGERRRMPRKLIVSIDTCGIQLPSFIVSIPFDKIVSLNPHMLVQLYEDMVKEENFISTEWTLTFQTDGIQQLICQKHMFVIKILVSMKWSLHYQSCVVSNNSCTILSDTSPVIYSVGALLTLLSKIEGAHVCIGNPDVSYLALAHKGKFLDQPGK